MTNLSQNNIQQSWLCLTSGCNNRCIFCYYGHKLSSEKTHVDIKHAKAILNLLLQLGVKDCALIGGEPTLYPYLTELIKYGNNIGIKLGIVTNGRVLKNLNTCKEIIDSGVDKISISLEGPDEITHDFITNSQGSFNDTVKAIENFKKLGFSVDVITTLCKTNMNLWKEIVLFLSNLGLNQFIFNICSPSISPTSKNIETPDLISLSDIIAEMLNTDYFGKSLNIVTPFPKCLVSDKTNIKVRLGLCQMFHGNGITIDVDGSILPCTHFTGGALFNIYDENSEVISIEEFKKIWENSAIKFQEKLWYYPSFKCANCEEWKDCYGGCPLYWLENNPDTVLNNYKNRIKVTSLDSNLPSHSKT